MAFIARFLAGIAGLLLVIFMTVLLMVPQTVGQLVDTLAEVPLVARVVVVLLIYVGLLIVVFARARTPQRSQTDSLVVRAPGAESAISVESVRNLVLKAVSSIPDMADVQAEVKSINGKADISLNVVTNNDALNVPAKQREINRSLEQVINKQLGLQMAGRPKVNIQFGKKPEPVIVTPPPARQEVVPPVVTVVPEKKEEPVVFNDSRIEPVIPEEKQEEPGFFDRLGFNRDEPAVIEPAEEPSDIFNNPDDVNRDS